MQIGEASMEVVEVVTTTVQCGGYDCNCGDDDDAFGSHICELFAVEKGFVAPVIKY